MAEGRVAGDQAEQPVQEKPVERRQQDLGRRLPGGTGLTGPHQLDDGRAGPGQQADQRATQPLMPARGDAGPPAPRSADNRGPSSRITARIVRSSSH